MPDVRPNDPDALPPTRFMTAIRRIDAANRGGIAYETAESDYVWADGLQWEIVEEQ